MASSRAKQAIEDLIRLGAKKVERPMLEIKVTQQNFADVADCLKIPQGQRESPARVLYYLEKTYKAFLEPAGGNEQKAVFSLSLFTLKFTQIQ